MFNDLEKLLDLETIHELISLLAEGGTYEYSDNGLNISAKSDENSFSLSMSYESGIDYAEQEAEDFKEFVEELDDELFIDVCESLGQDKLTEIANCVASNDIESVRSGVLRFKQELKSVLCDKIDYYKECLDNLTK